MCAANTREFAYGQCTFCIYEIDLQGVNSFNITSIVVQTTIPRLLYINSYACILLTLLLYGIIHVSLIYSIGKMVLTSLLKFLSSKHISSCTRVGIDFTIDIVWLFQYTLNIRKKRRKWIDVLRHFDLLPFVIFIYFFILSTSFTLFIFFSAPACLRNRVNNFMLFIQLFFLKAHECIMEILWMSGGVWERQ